MMNKKNLINYKTIKERSPKNNYLVLILLTFIILSQVSLVLSQDTGGKKFDSGNGGDTSSSGGGIVKVTGIWSFFKFLWSLLPNTSELDWTTTIIAWILPLLFIFFTYMMLYLVFTYLALICRVLWMIIINFGTDIRPLRIIASFFRKMALNFKFRNRKLDDKGKLIKVDSPRRGIMDEIPKFLGFLTWPLRIFLLFFWFWIYKTVGLEKIMIIIGKILGIVKTIGSLGIIPEDLWIISMIIGIIIFFIIYKVLIKYQAHVFKKLAMDVNNENLRRAWLMSRRAKKLEEEENLAWLGRHPNEKSLEEWDEQIDDSTD